MKYVYLLQHCYEINNCEEIKTIGIYSTEEIAQDVIRKIILLPGFKDFPESFHIDKYALDEDNWKEGFIKWNDAN